MEGRLMAVSIFRRRGVRMKVYPKVCGVHHVSPVTYPISRADKGVMVFNSQEQVFPPGLRVGPVNGLAGWFPGGFHEPVCPSDRVARARICSHRALSFRFLAAQPKPRVAAAWRLECAAATFFALLNPNSEIGEHTRPRVWLDEPRGQPLCARPLPKHPEPFRACEVFREGAENSTRGACAPHSTSESGLNTVQGKRTETTMPMSNRPASGQDRNALFPDESDSSLLKTGGFDLSINLEMSRMPPPMNPAGQVKIDDP